MKKHNHTLSLKEQSKKQNGAAQGQPFFVAIHNNYIIDGTCISFAWVQVPRIDVGSQCPISHVCCQGTVTSLFYDIFKLI